MASGGLRLKKIKFHYEGFNELRTAEKPAEELLRRGRAIADAAGGGEDVIALAEPNKTRARVVVVTATAKAMQDEASNRSLTRALDAGRS